MLASTTRRRCQLSLARPLIRIRSSYSTASPSLPSRDPLPPRVIRVFGLPLDYDVSTVVRTIVGTHLIEHVRPHPNHIALTCYNWRLASALSRKQLQLYDKEFRVAWKDSRHSDEDDSDLISAGTVARLGFLGVNRSLGVYLKDESDFDKDSWRSKLRAFGEFESMVFFVTKKNVHGFNITFLSAEACWQFYVKYIIMRRDPSFKYESVRINHPLGRPGLENITRGVVIRGLEATMAVSPSLHEFVESLSSTLFDAHFRRTCGYNRVTDIIQKSDLVFVNFISTKDAELFVENFPAAALKATVELTEKRPLTPSQWLAIQSGAGRALAIPLTHPLPLSLKEVFLDFSQFRGLVDVTMSMGHAILRFDTVVTASKTVCLLEIGGHKLPDTYTGARVSFLPTHGGPQTRPITISESYHKEGHPLARDVVQRWERLLRNQFREPSLYLPRESLEDLRPDIMEIDLSELDDDSDSDWQPWDFPGRTV